MLKFKVAVTLVEPMLGTASANPDIYKEFLQSRRQPDGAKAALGLAQANEDETATLPSVDAELQKSTTVFQRLDDKRPFIFDYQIKGFFKDTCSALARVPDTESANLTAFKKVIDGLVFVGPRRIPLNIPEGGEITYCQRPLRANTPQGERVALVRSEQVPAGTKLEIEVMLLDGRLEGLVHEWFNYGALRGFGQWRNSGMGRFEWTRLGFNDGTQLKLLPKKKAAKKVDDADAEVAAA